MNTGFPYIPFMNTPSSIDWNDANEAKHFAKHGIHFDFAARVFLDDDRIETADLRKAHNPFRFNTVGVVDGLTINVTYALEGDTAQIISARPASRKERKSYG